MLTVVLLKYIQVIYKQLDFIPVVDENLGILCYLFKSDVKDERSDDRFFARPKTCKINSF